MRCILEAAALDSLPLLLVRKQEACSLKRQLLLLSGFKKKKGAIFNADNGFIADVITS